MNQERVFLTKEQAEAMLGKGDYIHTFRQAMGALIGADWDRSEILKAFETLKPELSGPQASAMNHGIVFYDLHGAVFVETIPAIEPIPLTPERHELETPE
jgi:hypothetical protein